LNGILSKSDAEDPDTIAHLHSITYRIGVKLEVKATYNSFSKDVWKSMGKDY